MFDKARASARAFPFCPKCTVSKLITMPVANDGANHAPTSPYLANEFTHGRINQMLEPSPKQNSGSFRQRVDANNY